MVIGANRWLVDQTVSGGQLKVIRVVESPANYMWIVYITIVSLQSEKNWFSSLCTKKLEFASAFLRMVNYGT